MTNNDKIHKIQQTLEHLTVALKSDYGLQKFETVETPFQLTQACIQLWTDCFSIAMLQNLASHDPETLELWAIALNTTLQVQLGILNQWMPFLSLPSLPLELQKRIEKRTAELHQIAQEKSALIQAAPNLLLQETQLRNDFRDISTLKVKFNELQAIEAEINATDFATLRAEVDQKERDLLPQKQILDQLSTQIACLHEQQEILESEIAEGKFRQERQELEAMSQINQLIALTQTAKAQLSFALTQALENLASQRQEYNQQWEELQQSIRDCNQYYAEKEGIRDDIHAHYQVDTALGKHLPIASDRIKELTQIIQESLAELDRELQTVHANYEHAQQKQYFNFDRKR